MAKTGAGGPSRRGSHAMADSLGCEVRWYLYAFERFVPKQAEGPRRPGRDRDYYLRVGTLLHTAIAYYYAEKMVDRKPQWFIDYPDLMPALEEDGKGRPNEIRMVLAALEAYREWEIAHPWDPVYVEEELETTVGVLDPEGEDEPEEELVFVDSKGKKTVQLLPTLNNEYVTCRPDIIFRENGLMHMGDHKGASAGRNSNGLLPVIGDDNPDFTYSWQAMVNLHIARANGLPIESFQFNRIKREKPFDCKRHTWTPPERMYAKVPSSIRQAIKNDRARRRKVARGEALIPHPNECQTQWGPCTYTRICYAHSLQNRNEVLANEFLRDQ